MPAFSTHYIFAKELLPELRKISPCNIIDEVVLIGSQGPDIFFFHRVFPWMIGKSLRKIGSALHRAKPSEIFDSMLEYAKSSTKKDIAFSYIFGFVMHYALDRSCHPFVYSLQEKLTENPVYRNPHTAHNIIELSMDTYLLSRRLGIEKPEKFSTADTIKITDEQAVEIAGLLEYTIEKVLGKSTTKNIALAIKDTKTIQKITHDKTGIKRILIALIDIPVSLSAGGYKFSAMIRPKDLEKAKKYANINCKSWKSPFDNSIRKESFEELFELAKRDAVSMIGRLIDGDDTKEITNNISFLTGVEVK